MKPDILKHCVIDILLDAFQCLTMEKRRLTCKLCEQCHLFPVRDLLLQEYLLRLCQHDVYEGANSGMVEIGRRSMKKIFVYICEHPCRRLERVVGSLKT